MKTHDSKDYIIYGSNTFDHATKKLTTIFKENILFDNAQTPSIELNDIKGKHDTIYIRAHGRINDKGKHEICLLNDEFKTYKAIEKIQNKTQAQNIIVASCQSAQLVHDLTNSGTDLNNKTKILIIGSKNHPSFSENNQLILNKIKEYSDKDIALEEIFSLLARELGQTFQYGEFSREKGYQFVKRNSKEDNKGLEFRRGCDEEFKTKMQNLYDKIDKDDPNRPNSAFLEAIGRGIEERATYWLNNGANINQAQDINESSPLEISIRLDNKKMLHFLLSKNADIEQEGFNGEKPLHTAIYMNNSEICQILADKGADIYNENNLGISALDYAKSKGNSEIIQVLENKQNELFHQHHENYESSEKDYSSYEMEDLLGGLGECLDDLESLMDSSEIPPSPILQESQVTETFPPQKQKGLE